MKLFIEKSRFRVGAGERKRLWWRTEQTICLYYQKIIQIRIDILCLRQAQAPTWNSSSAFDRLRHRFSDRGWKHNTGDWAEAKSQGRGIRMCLRQAQAPKVTRWLSGAEITGMRIRMCLRQAQAPRVTRWLSGAEITGWGIRMCLRQAQASGVVIINLSYKSLKIWYFFCKFRVSIK